MSVRQQAAVDKLDKIETRARMIATRLVDLARFHGERSFANETKLLMALGHLSDLKRVFNEKYKARK